MDQKIKATDVNNHLVAEGKQQIENLKEKTMEIGKDIVDKGKEIKDQALGWIQKNPVKSVGLAFLLGFICAKK